jgi:hypothetical protein
MKAVSRFETRLLKILSAFLRRTPVEQVRPLVVGSDIRPPCLSHPAVELVQDYLAKGCVHLLARQDGWRRERYLRGERVVEGRLWERTAPQELGLKFSRHTLGFLVWITAVQLDEGAVWKAPERELTPADRLFLYLAFDALVPVNIAPLLAASPVFQRNALCRLAYPERFFRAPADAVPDFAPWTTGLGAGILEALQGRLAAHCQHTERSKGDIDRWERMQAVGRAQEQALQAFLETVEKAGRIDLARFLLRAAAEVVIEGVKAERWTGRLTGAGLRLADRSETYRAALLLLHQLPRLRDWTRKARGVGYFDEGYAASQLWLADWERWQGNLLCTCAEAVVRQLDPMKQT